MSTQQQVKSEQRLDIALGHPNLKCSGYLFYSNFDSGNLARVEVVPKNESALITVTKNGKEVPEIPDVEFNIWTRPDCVGTEFENGNRTWFYFGIKGLHPGILLRLNLVDLNRQAKMYSQGMAPVFKVVPGRGIWERIRDKPTYSVSDNIFTLSFKFRTPDNPDAVVFFAFTYPYTYSELQNYLISVDQRFFTVARYYTPTSDEVYYVRECICKSLEGRRIDLITISSYYNITGHREDRLKHLFPDNNVGRPFKFHNKKIIFVSARVHPGETPSSFVFKGMLDFLLKRDDPTAIALRRLYVFKMIPFLNPDGVAKGHYRTDTRGVNLNRVYLEPTLAEHPSVYAARKLVQYYHFGFDREEHTLKFYEPLKDEQDNKVTEQVQILSLNDATTPTPASANVSGESSIAKKKYRCAKCDQIFSQVDSGEPKIIDPIIIAKPCTMYCNKCMKELGVFMYIDMHGHASKKGIFMYGNHFEDIESNIECMMLAKVMSINNHNFHFNACNFTERNMYLRDRRDGMSREGSGRVSVYKMTGIIRSYTLECNYNTGRMVNVLPPMSKEGPTKTANSIPIPPKYTPHIFEEVGSALALSILDLTGQNPNSRIPNSEFHSMTGIRDWLRVNCTSDSNIMPRFAARNKSTISNQSNIRTPRCKSMKNLSLKRRVPTTKLSVTSAKKAMVPRSSALATAVGDKKENVTNNRDTVTITNNNISNKRPMDSSVVHSVTSSSSKLFKSKGLSLRKTPTKKPGVGARDNNRPNTNLTHRSCQTSNTSLNGVTGSGSTVGSVPVAETPASATASKQEILPIANSSTTTTVAKKETKKYPITKEIPSRRVRKIADTSGSRLRLREICYIKENLTKKLIAKFSKNDSMASVDSDELVLSWDPSYSPKVLSKYDRKTTQSGSGGVGSAGNNNNTTTTTPTATTTTIAAASPTTNQANFEKIMPEPSSSRSSHQHHYHHHYHHHQQQQQQTATIPPSSLTVAPVSVTVPVTKGSFKSSTYTPVKCKVSKASIRRFSTSSYDTNGKIDKLKKRKKLKSGKLL